MKLFHGSDNPIIFPEIRQGKYTKDFGSGFYCTKLKEQAIRWACRFAVPCLNLYEFDEFGKSSLNVCDFSEMSEEWLDFIIHCRNGGNHDYDLVIGAMADDQIYNYVSDVLDGIITREQFWVLAQFKKPTHQIAFCSEKALSFLKFISCKELK